MPPSRTSSNPDCVVIGGGVIGLSIAYELACAGVSVTLLERGQPGREASWAGAGVLPPASWYSDHPLLDALALEAAVMHRDLARRLLAETRIDTEYWPCGALYLETPENASYVAAALDRWRTLGVAVEPASAFGGADSAWSVPAEAQVRNPRCLRALAAACERRGVAIVADTGVEALERAAERVAAAVTTRGRFEAASFVLAAGCWSPGVAESASVRLEGRPIRGQMALLSPGALRLEQTVHLYPYYAVPRRDGRVLVGATVEDVGFDRGTTANARDELLSVARRLLPAGFGGIEVEAFWSGLRPRGSGELPQVGPAPELANLWVATGHYRSGLQLAPPTARLVRRMICGEPIEPEFAALAPTAARPAAVAT